MMPEDEIGAVALRLEAHMRRLEPKFIGVGVGEDAAGFIKLYVYVDRRGKSTARLSEFEDYPVETLAIAPPVPA